MHQRQAQMPEPPLDVAAVYQEHAAFVWRVVRLLGVPAASVEDVAHDVFMVVHRRLGEFEGRSSIRTWLYAIARGVAANHRRGTARRGAAAPVDERLRDTSAGADPRGAAERAEAGRILAELVGRLDEEKREVFVLVEVEELPVTEVAELLAIPVNTAYSRLRAARVAFERELVARRGKDEGR